MSKLEHSNTIFNKKTWIWLAVILVVTLVAYSPAFKADFTNWDDDVYVTQNEDVQSLSGETMGRYFSQPYGKLYQPLTMLSLAIDYSISDGSAAFSHFVNVFLHLLNTLLVFWFIHLLTNNFKVALVAAALFGVHTLHVESVAWITERKDVLYTCFFLLSLIHYVRYVQLGKTKHYAFALLLFVGALLSKGMAVTLAVSLVAIDFFLQRKLLSKKVMLEKVPFFLVAIASGLLTVSILRSHDVFVQSEDHGLVRQFIFGNYALVQYLLKTIFPFKLSAIYPYPIAKEAAIGAFYWVFPVLGLGFLGVLGWAIKRSRALAFGLAFFFINIVLVLQVVPVGIAYNADRFTYVPSIGLFFLLGMGYVSLEARKSMRTALPYIAGTYVLVLTVMTFQRVKVWENSLTLWNDTLSKYEHHMGYSNRGLYKMENGDPQGAIADYNQSIAMYSDAPLSWYNRGVARGMLGQYNDAIADFSTSLQLDSTNASAFSNRGLMLASIGKHQQALLDYDRAILLQPDHVDALTNRGTAKYNTNDFGGAIADLNAAIALKADHGLAYYIRGMSAIQLQQGQAGCNDLQAAFNYGFGQAQQALQQYCR